MGKAEFQNPGGSVKDRAALGVVRDAEQRGLYVCFLISNKHFLKKLFFLVSSLEELL